LAAGVLERGGRRRREEREAIMGRNGREWYSTKFEE